ncbi:MAG: flagellar motor protein MotB [Beijerinckiaceae bacterium]|nr:flagellar motor protein MotB [Beijerinckiaceae bacterium]
MARKKAAHAGGHGWFVTFADLMGLLMSFFVMLVAFSTQDSKKLQIVAGSMRDAFGNQKESRNAGIVELDGIPVRPNLQNVEQAPTDQGSDITAPIRFEKRDNGLILVLHDRNFAMAAASLRQALQDLPDFAEISKNVVIEETKEGLDLQIVDQDGRSMFPEGSTIPYERTRKILEKLGPSLRKLPNRIRISGHTSGVRGATRPGGAAWQVSTERALAVRDILSDAGVPDDRFQSVIGKADTEPTFPDDPYIAANRRISILLLREAPPLPAKPLARPDGAIKVGPAKKTSE